MKPHFHFDHPLTPAEAAMLRPSYWLVTIIGTLAAAIGTVLVLSGAGF